MRFGFGKTGSMALLAISAGALAGCGDSGSGVTSPSASPAVTTNVTLASDRLALTHPAMIGYKLSTFAVGSQDASAPDSVVVDGDHVYVGWQNVTAKDGSDNKTSTIIEYDRQGKELKRFAVPGHNDGLRVDPATHLVWATSNEDGNPKLVTIDPGSGAMTPYVFPAAPHGGGYDDVYFTGGHAYIVASNPTLDASGANPFPAVDQIVLAAGQVQLTPVLLGNAHASAPDTSTTPPGTKDVTLTLSDPDSLSVNSRGDLVLVSQGDSALITIANPGSPQQKVSQLPVGTQLDDTVWVPAGKDRRLLLTDGGTNAVFTITIANSLGGILTEAPNDSGVAGFVGTIAPDTGTITPVIIGFNKPTGLVYLPN